MIILIPMTFIEPFKYLIIVLWICYDLKKLKEKYLFLYHSILKKFSVKSTDETKLKDNGSSESFNEDNNNNNNGDNNVESIEMNNEGSNYKLLEDK
jgi:hypothetical protein